MSFIAALGSGSSGNSTFIGNQNNGILIDAGLSTRAIVNGLSSVNLSIERVGAIFITHEHSDHIKGLRVLTKKYKTPIYADPQIAAYLTRNDLVDISADVRIFEYDSPVCIGDMNVIPFQTPHDSLESSGFIVCTADEKKIALVTDLGEITETVEKNIIGCDLLMLESNYDNKMLARSSYPRHLKLRIASQTGHLSNNDCAKMLAKAVRGGTARIMLAHLSKENNSEHLAHQTATAFLHQYKMSENEDYILKIAKRTEAVMMKC